jgi:hypothetical protein
VVGDDGQDAKGSADHAALFSQGSHHTMDGPGDTTRCRHGDLRAQALWCPRWVYPADGSDAARSLPQQGAAAAAVREKNGSGGMRLCKMIAK